MTLNTEFFESVMNSLAEHIVVIDDDGLIASVNTAWVRFAAKNGSSRTTSESWMGIDYLNVCDASAVAGDPDGEAAAEGARGVIAGLKEAFYHEYPCHSPVEQRWFLMRITPLDWGGPHRFVISHHNITERKLAEEKVSELALLDGLTELPNRRRFDDFLAVEWRRGMREKKPVSLLMIDVDHFKLLNDHYGHTVGDEVLQRIASALGQLGRRPGDLPARYGGEEFALVMGDTDAAAARMMADEALAAIQRLEIPHAASPSADHVTVSVGVATLLPAADTDESALVIAADGALYAAKRGGRNRVTVQGM